MWHAHYPVVNVRLAPVQVLMLYSSFLHLLHARFGWPKISTLYLDISSNPLTVTLGIVSFWERLPDIHCYDYRDAARQLKKLFVLADGSVTHAVLASDWENTWQIGDSLEPRGFHQQTTGSSHEKCELNWQTWRFNFIYLYLIFNRWKQRNNENQNMGMMINPWNSGA